MKEIGPWIFISVWLLMVTGYGTWMIIWPEKYWASWQGYLDKYSDIREKSIYTARYEWIEQHMKTDNPKRKARRIGVCFIIVGIGVGLLIGRVQLYGPF